jgi:hypothetical protein
VGKANSVQWSYQRILPNGRKVRKRFGDPELNGLEIGDAFECSRSNWPGRPRREEPPLASALATPAETRFL